MIFYFPNRIALAQCDFLFIKNGLGLKSDRTFPGSSVPDEIFDMAGHDLRVVVHDHVTTFDPGRNLSVRDEEFVEESTVADDEVAALQQRQRRLLRVDDQRRPRPRRRQEVSRASEVVDVAVPRQHGDHQRKCNRTTLK